MKTFMILTTFTAGLMASVSTAAANWPERPVTIVVSQGAGASPDIMARVLADGLSRVLGGQFIVDNRPGGGNVVGAMSVAEADPDGYTLFFATSAALVTNPYLLANLPYDTEEDFDAAALVAMSNIMVVSNPDNGIETIDDLVESERSNPGSISIGVDSPRNLSGIIARSINHEAGIDLTLVSYNQITQAVTDAISGVIPVTIQSASVAAPYLQEGTLKAVAVASGQPSAAHPDVPTIASTLPGIDLTGWFMMVAPEGTDREILETLNGAVREVLAQPDVIAQADNLGFELMDLDVDASAEFLSGELENWAQITANLGIEPE